VCRTIYGSHDRRGIQNKVDEVLVLLLRAVDSDNDIHISLPLSQSRARVLGVPFHVSICDPFRTVRHSIVCNNWISQINILYNLSPFSCFEKLIKHVVTRYLNCQNIDSATSRNSFLPPTCWNPLLFEQSKLRPADIRRPAAQRYSTPA
jgi:hypothetical protein